jgi:Ca-activated chloride channel family protein
MTFLLPLGLLALLTLPLIIVLHLLRERRRRMAVPSLLHWLNVPRRREGERIRRLPLTLLLLLHLLIAALLGLALGRPQLAGALNGAARQTVIVLDTSTSMATREDLSGGSSTRFAQARMRALALLRALQAGDRATLIAAGPTAQVVADGGAGDLAALTAALDRLRPGGDGADMIGALTLAEATIDPRREHRIVAISDGGLPSPEPPPNRGGDGGGSPPVDWQIVGSDQPNRAIISFAARSWGGKLQVYARAANYDRAPFRTTLRLYGDERLIDTRALSIAAERETELTWTLPTGYATLRATLDGRDALPEDDQGFLAVAPARPITALLVSARPEPLRRALAAAGAQVTVVETSRYSDTLTAGRAVDLTVFDSFLPQAWPAGAALAINPPPASALLPGGSSRPFTSNEPQSDDPKEQLTQTGAILEGLSLGGVRFGTVRSIKPPAWATTQLALGDKPLILRGRSGSSEIAIWAFDLASSNLPTRLAFPLLVARTVRDLAPAPLPSAIQAGAPLALRSDPRVNTLQFTAPDGTRATVRSTPALVIETLTQPGFYRIESQGGSAPGMVGQVGVNAGSAAESDLRRRVGIAAASSLQFNAAAGAPERRAQAIDLWPWLALGALALLMLEWGYIHR